MRETYYKYPDYSAAIFSCGENEQLTNAVQAFRKELFVDHLKWDLFTSNELEIDEFDTSDATYCAIFRKRKIVATWRAIRTDSKYLAEKVFPDLAVSRAYPKSRYVWEISRFGVLGSDEPDFVAMLNYSVMFSFGQKRQAKAFVAIADLLYERYLKQKGIRNPPLRPTANHRC